MLDINFSLNLQDIERDLKQIRVQNIKENKIPEQNCTVKVINILSCSVVLNDSLGGFPPCNPGCLQDFSLYYFMELPYFVMFD